MRKALYFKKLIDDSVQCELCPRECTLKPEQSGFCRGKVNKAGELYSTIYAEVSAIAIDPIEKKPLYHFYPGTEVLSIGTVGCNLGCKFCQNWHIAHEDARTERFESEQLVEIALHHHSVGIAYTYSEPLIWYEFVLDTARLAREAGLKNILVSNGMIREKPLLELLPYIDAMNLDVKAFQQEFYQRVCGGGDLQTVKRTAELAHQNCHLEITTLLIPGLNDEPHEVKNLVQWLAELSTDIPLHLSRYFPQYQLDLPPTPLERMHQAREIASEQMHYVYLGNVPEEDRNTYCYRCHYPVVKREGSVKVDLSEGLCPECGEMISLIL